MRIGRAFILAAALAGAAVAGAARAETQTFVVVANGEKVGHLDADVTAAGATIDYGVTNNGRGAKSKETLVFGEGGAPSRWTIEGTSLFGNAVHESFEWKAGTATWAGQADKGKVKAPKLMFYAAADASPWIQGLYARALLKAPDHTLPVLPTGSMRLEELKKLDVGSGDRTVHVTLYQVGGLELNPTLVALDDKGDLFALPGEGLVRTGYEAALPVIGRANRDLALARAEAAQEKLAHRFPGPVLIRNVRVFDPASGIVGGPSQVEVFGDKIVAVIPETSAPAPKGVTMIDGQGGTLVPGLHDMHHHLSLNSALYLLAAGVTGIRDMGNDNTSMLAWNKLIDDGKLAGPRIVRNGLLEGRSPYSIRGNGMLADTLEQALADVRWYADHGYWQVKFYNSFPPDWVAPAAAEAHRLGMGVTGHVPAFSSPDRVLKEGYNDIAHINQLMLGWILDPSEDTRTPLRLTGMARGATLDLNSPRVQTTVRLMKDKGAKLDTTTVILERLMLSRAGVVQPGDAPYLSHMPIGYQRNRKRTFAILEKPSDDAAYQAGFQKILQVMKMLDDNGIEMLPGTDDGTGFTLLRELELYVKAGIPAAKTLRLATLDDEKYFGHDQQLGSIARGKLADFILVDGDPTQDISKIRNTRMTMKGGVAYYPAEIYRHLNIEPFSAPPPVTAPTP
jgi:hypothetical protein